MKVIPSTNRQHEWGWFGIMSGANPLGTMSVMPFDSVAHGGYKHAQTMLARAGLRATSLDLFDNTAPDLIALLGQQSVVDLIESVIKIYPKTSASVVDLIIASSLHPALKLGSSSAFKHYLLLLEELVAVAPRGLRPMLAKQDILLERVGIAGLQRWVRNGIARYSRDFSGLAHYFALENAASWNMLNLEGSNTLFIHERRRIALYLRALWGREFKLQSFPVGTDTNDGLVRSFIDEHHVIHLPDTFGSMSGRTGQDVYRAAAVHAAAHILYSRQTFLRQKINPMQNSLIGLIEDARVEALVMRDFPGLRNLWLDMYTPSIYLNTDFLSLARRLTRALLDPDYIDDNAWVKKGRALFLAQQHDWTDPQMAIRLGLLLANDLGQMRVKFNAPGYLVEPAYRDDNRVLWEPLEVKAPLPDQIQADQNEAATESAEVCNIVATQDINNILITTAFFYPEWDYRLGLVRSNRARVVEQPCDEADISIVTTIEEQTQLVLTKLKRINKTVRPNLLRRQKKYEEGDELDLEATIRAAVDIRQQRTPDMRIHSRFVRSVQQVSVLLLLDLSASTNQSLPDTDKTVLDLVRETAVLLAGTVTDLGDDFAIHGFSSNGRNQVEYYRLQDFAESYNEQIKMRLAGMTGKFSTRLGAAIRHAGHYLAQQSGTHKILLIVSDGEPADIDEADAHYLVHDAAHAVKHLRSMGMDCFGLNLDTNTAPQATHIFGKKAYRMLEDISRLPEIMPAIYLQLRI